MGFTCEDDARGVLDVLPKRLSRYGLTIHPDKTRLLVFQPRDRADRSASSQGSAPGTFDFLGFTHFWGLSRKGVWVVKRGTASSRLRRALQKIAQWCRLNRHRPVSEQHQTLSQKLLGHFAYFGLTGNSEGLRRYRAAATRTWRQSLSPRTRHRLSRPLLTPFPSR